jgi:hypothetical protein
MLRGFVKSNYGLLILLEPVQRGTALRAYMVADKVARELASKRKL